MTTMHPDWQSTDDEASVPVRDANATRAPMKASRFPAAAVGIVAMVGIVAFSFGNIRELLGQLTDPTPDVTITLKADGPDPDSATVAPGQVIRFVNADEIPHVLSSDDLPTDDGSPFETSIIFAGDDNFYAVPSNATAGTYAYISQTNPDFSGQIDIVTTVAASASSISSVEVVAVSSASSVSSIPRLPDPRSSAGPVPLPTSASSVTPSPLPAGVLAVNPHVVGAKTGRSSASAKPGVTQHRPVSTTESGPETWIVLGCAAVAFAMAAKGAFRRA